MNFITTPIDDITPPHQILFHYGIGDAQVSYTGAHILSRSTGAMMFVSNVHNGNETLFGFDFIDDNQLGNTSMIVGWEFDGVPPAPEENIPANKYFFFSFLFFFLSLPFSFLLTGCYFDFVHYLFIQ